MRFGLVTPTADVAPIWLAKEDGIFAKYGVDAERATMNADLLTPALISGEIPMAVMAATALVNAGLGGADLVYAGSFQDYLRLWFYARPEIATVGDLRGKPVGITGRGGITRRAAELVLSRNGLNPEQDVNMVITGNLANSTTSLLSGAVSAAVLGAPGIFEAADAGMRLLVNTADYRYETILGGIAVSRGWVARNEELSRRLFQVVVEGIAAAHQNKERTKQIMAKYMQTDDPVLLERTYNATAPGWEKKLVVPPGALQSELDSIAPDNPAGRNAKPDQFVDNHLAEDLERSSFIQRLYQ